MKGLLFERGSDHGESKKQLPLKPNFWLKNISHTFFSNLVKIPISKPRPSSPTNNTLAL